MQKIHKINKENIKKNRVDFERGWILIRWILIVYQQQALIILKFISFIQLYK